MLCWRKVGFEAVRAKLVDAKSSSEIATAVCVWFQMNEPRAGKVGGFKPHDRGAVCISSNPDYLAHTLLSIRNSTGKPATTKFYLTPIIFSELQSLVRWLEPTESLPYPDRYVPHVAYSRRRQIQARRPLRRSFRMAVAGSAANPSRRPSSISACRRCAKASCTAEPDRSDGAVLSAARAGLRRLLPGAAAGVRQPGAHFHRVRVFLVVFDVLGRARAPVLRNDQGTARSLDANSQVSRSRATTDICFSISCHSAFRCSASSRPPTWPRSRERQGYSDAGRVLRARDFAQRARRRGQAGRSHHRQQRAGAGPDLNDFTAGMAHLLRPTA